MKYLWRHTQEPINYSQRGKPDGWIREEGGFFFHVPIEVLKFKLCEYITCCQK